MGKCSFCCGQTCRYTFAALVAIIVGWIGYIHSQLPELHVKYTPNGEEEYVETYILNFKNEDYHTDEPVVADLGMFMPIIKYMLPVMMWTSPFLSDPVRIHNGRLFEKSEGLTKAQFFEKHGFVLLKAPTVMEDHDWMNNSISAEDGYGNDMSFDEESPIAQKYGKEVLDMIYEQLFEPGTVKKVQLPNKCLRRGEGAPTSFYGYGAHIDVENTLENILHTSEGYYGKDVLKAYLESDHFETINFWRPVKPMKGPIRRAPLAVVDSPTVDKNDTFLQITKGGPIPEGVEQRQLYLRRNAAQRWYYYPEMTLDEVLVMKQVVYKGPEHDGNLEPVFHSAFDHPRTPEDAETRQSAEYRVNVFF